MADCKRAVSLLVTYANKTADAKDLLTGWNKVLQFNLVGEDPFYIEAKDGQVLLHDGKHANPDVTFKATSEFFLKIIKGDVNPDEAFLSRKYEVSGSIIDASKFRRLAEIVQNSHKAMFSVLKTLSKFT